MEIYKVSGEPPGHLWTPQLTPNGPCKDNFRGPLVEKGPPGSLHGPNWPILLDMSQDNWLKLKFTTWFEVNPTFGSREMIFKTWWANLPPPPTWLGLRNEFQLRVHHFVHKMFLRPTYDCCECVLKSIKLTFFPNSTFQPFPCFFLLNGWKNNHFCLRVFSLKVTFL